MSIPASPSPRIPAGKRPIFALLLAATVLLLFVSQDATAGELPRVRVAGDQRGFELAESRTKFTPWGFNYDHDRAGKLVEDYWDSDFKTIEEDFAEMKQLGANVVRIHLQLGKFMDKPDAPNEKSLAKLVRLLRLAEKSELYLDITGLGCYHKADVPPWYDRLDEQQRWDVQARFWEAIAKTCAKSPAVFCYDLMNEPVVPGGDKPRDDWLGGAFGGKHFVQFIALDRAGRDRAKIAEAWIKQLVAAVRRHDRQTLVTVGLVPWSLDRPGLTSGFDPTKVAGPLDFVSVHIYPEKGKVDEALETLKGYSVGKPVVVEEMFPLKCSPPELGEFIDRSKSAQTAAGWIGFYWGTTRDEYRAQKTIEAAIVGAWLDLFRAKSKAITR